MFTLPSLSQLSSTITIDKSKEKVLLIFLLVLLICIFLYFLLIRKKETAFLQLFNTKSIEIKHSLIPFQVYNFDFDVYSPIMDSLFYPSKNFISVQDHNILFNYEGLYEINLSIAGSKRINVLPSLDPPIVEDEELFTDCFVEWSFNYVEANSSATSSLDHDVIPVFSDHRVNGPEFLSYYSKIIKVQSVPHTVFLSFKNIDTRILEKFTLNNFILTIKKIQ